MTKYLWFAFLFYTPQLWAESTASEGRIAVTGGNIWYSIQGKDEGIPLVVIHGGPGSSSCNLTGLAALGEHRQVIFYDQLGAGKSDQPDDVSLWQPQRFADELDQLLKQLKLSRVHLLAHSWGAAIAGLYLMDKGSENVASVIYASPYLSSKDWIKDTNELRHQLPRATQLILRQHEQAGTINSPEYQDAMGEFYRKHLFHQAANATNDCGDRDWNPKIYEAMWGDSEFSVTGSLKNFDVTKGLAKTSVPTLFLIGEFDEVRASTAYKYQRQMPNASVTVLKDAAHMAMIDEPQAFLAAVDSFLTNAENKKAALAAAITPSNGN